MTPKVVFLIGAMKCGTNTIYHGLRLNKGSTTPAKKELDYFRQDDVSLEGYCENFDINDEPRILVDGTTQYSKFPQIKFIPEKIKSVFPDAKIIYQMRDPVARAESQIAHHIARQERVTLDNWRETPSYRSAISYSSYYQQISLYYQQFPAENIFLGIFEDMVSDPADYLRRVSEFVGLDSEKNPGDVKARNPRRSDNDADKFRFTPEDDRAVANALLNDILCLEKTYGVDTSHWKRFWGGVKHD